MQCAMNGSIDSWKNVNGKSLPSEEKYFSELNNEEISDKKLLTCTKNM